MSKGPVRLEKDANNFSFSNRIEAWVLSHAHILLPLFIIIALILFVMICFAICGVSAVESGGMRNFVNRSFI